MTPDAPLLLLDASSRTVQVGLWREGRWLAYAGTAETALEGLFSAVNEVLHIGQTPLSGLGGFLFCEGPGSVLGIRLAAMAVSTWRALPGMKTRPVLAYRSTDLAACLVERTAPSPWPFHILTESRMERWAVLTCPAPGQREPLREVTHEEAEALPGAIWHLSQRKAWRAAPTRATSLPYSLEKCPEVFATPALVRPIETPDVFTASPADYRKWEPQRHRSPVHPASEGGSRGPKP